MKKNFTLLAALLLILQVAYAGEIHDAAKSGDIVKLKALLDKDPGLLYVQDEQGKTPLHWAVGKGQPEAAKVLLDTYHVDVNVRNKNNGTPLHVAASQAQPESAKILIAHGALIDPRAKDGATPLHFAAFKGRKSGHIETAKILIEHGADVNAERNDGRTPLDLAVFRNNTEIIAILLKHGGKVGRPMSKMRQVSEMGWEVD